MYRNQQSPIMTIIDRHYNGFSADLQVACSRQQPVEVEYQKLINTNRSTSTRAAEIVRD